MDLIPIGRVTAAFNACADFYDPKKRLSSNALAELVRDELRTIWSADSPPTLLYLRHTMSRGLNKLWALSPRLVPVATKNWQLGLYSPPQVLDALHSFRSKPTAHTVQVSFDSSCRDVVATFGSREHFNAELTIPLNHTSEYISGGEHIRRPAFSEVLLEEPPPVDSFTVNTHLFGEESGLFSLLAPSIIPLCDYFALPHSVTNYRAIAASLFYLRRFAPALSMSTTLFVPTTLPDGVATGVVCFGHGSSGEWVEKLAARLRQLESDIASYLTQLPEPSGRVQETCHRFVEFNETESYSEIPEDVAKAVSERILSTPHYSGRQRFNAVEYAVKRFLVRCIAFSDIREEGRSVEIGMVLGDPFSLRYWPGVHPLPLLGSPPPEIAPDPDASEHTCLSLLEIKKRIEYIANPRGRCLVFPFDAEYPVKLRGRGHDDHLDPAFTIDLSDYVEPVVSWPRSLLWSSTAGVYACISAYNPSCATALVGPGSLIRIFCQGELTAFRDGQGWSWRNEDLRLASHDLPILQILDVAQHLSPRLNPGAHGGLVVYYKDSDALSKMLRRDGLSSGGQDHETLSVRLQELHAGETFRLDESPWITQRHLLHSDGTVDLRVGRLLLRTGLVDGATVLVGPRATVLKYGVRVTLDRPSQVDKGGGTKHATARQWARLLGPGAFAVAVSSSGPVTAFVGEDSPRGVQRLPMFTSRDQKARKS